MHELTILNRSAIEAYDMLSVPVWLFSADTLKILASNEAARQWVGYDAETLHAMTIADLRPENDRGRHAAHVRQFQGAASHADTWTIVARSGQHYTASFGWKKVMFDGAVAVVASIHDMTQAAQARTNATTLATDLAALKRKEKLQTQHFAWLLEAVPGKMLVLTPGDYTIVALTDDYAKAVNARREAILGRPLFEAFPDNPDEPDADGARNLLASLRRVETLHLTDVMNLQRYPVRTPDGHFQERFWLPLNKPVFDDAGQLLYIIHRTEDVTELLAGRDAPVHPDRHGDGDAVVQSFADTRATFVALQERETRLHTAESLLQIGAWEFDPKRNIFNWSKRVLDIYGLTEDQGPKSLDAYVAMVHPDDRARILATYTAFMEGAESLLQFEHRIRKRDGSVAYVRGVGTRHSIANRQLVIGYVQDISHQKLAEQRLIDAARLQKRAGYMARLGGWRFDLTAQRITWSPETAAIHDEPAGTSPELEDGLNYYAPEYRNRIREVFRACTSSGESFDETLQIITATGRRVWVRSIGEAVRSDSGKIVAVEGAFQDISELVAARDASEDLSRRLHQTLDSISDAFFLLDDEWLFTFLNDQALKLLQRRREDLLGKEVWQEFPDALNSRFQTEYERAVREGRTVSFHGYYPSLDAWFDVAAYPTPEGLAVYFRDITQHKIDQHTLQLNEERFRFVAKATGSAVWDWDVVTGNQWWSEGLQEVFGHAPASDDARRSVWQDNIHPEDKARMEQAQTAMLSGELASFNGRYRFRRANGSWATVEDRAYAIHDDEGKVVRLLGSITDSSERQQLEDRLHQSQKMEAVGQLTGGVAHDFNNLLTVIMGNSEILSEELAERPDLQPIAQLITNAGLRGAELTSHLLAFSRRQALQPHVLDIRNLTQGMESLLRRALPETINIEIIRAAGLWKTELDPGQLESALLNLALNARDAMADGGCLTIEMANATLDEDYVSREPGIQPGQYVLITVTDTGHGIAADIIGKIFEPFFTTKDVGKGSGLGLSMVYGFVKQSGGHIRVYSEPGEGSSFKLYFPRSCKPGSREAPIAARYSVAGGGETILVVEDDNLVRQHAIKQLEGLGYRVLNAPAAKEALEIIRQHLHIDLLFTDVVMPGGMGGRALAEAALALRPALKVLFTSGYTQNSIVHNGKLDPGVDLLTKPYRRDQLALKLRQVLEKR